MTIQDILADIYRRLGATLPDGVGLPDILTDIYARLGLVPPSGIPLPYVLDDIYAHLEAGTATKGKRRTT
jgi:hypothetical protein